MSLTAHVFSLFALISSMSAIGELRAAIVIDRIEPASGPVGTKVVIEGKELGTVTQVLFNGVNAVFERDLIENVLRTTVPVGAVSGPIVLLGRGSVVGSLDVFSVTQLLPEIVSFTRQGPSGSEIVVVLSMSLPVTEVRVGGIKTTFEVLSEFYLVARVPPVAVTGKLSLSFQDGNVTTGEDFQVTSIPSGREPRISVIDPSAGAPGAEVRIDGTNLNEVLLVTFNSVSATFRVTEGRVIATVPVGARDGIISVLTREGRTSNGQIFKILTGLQILSFSPAGRRGDTIVIEMDKSTPLTGIEFGGAQASVFSLSIPGRFIYIATVPKDAVSGPITVLYRDGKFVTTHSFNVVLDGDASLPSIDGFAPRQASVGSEIEVALRNVQSEILQVRVGGVVSTFSESGGRLRVMVPPQAVSGSIWVVSMQGQFESSDRFQPGPVVVTGQEPICMTWDQENGENLRGYRVHLADEKGRLFYINDVELNQPPNTCEKMDLRSVLPGNGMYQVWLTAIDKFDVQSKPSDVLEFQLVPTIRSVSTDSTYIEKSVRVTGSGLRQATSVRLGGVSADFKVLGDDMLDMLIPVDAKSGSIDIQTVGGKVTSPLVIEVIPSCDLEVLQLQIPRVVVTNILFACTMTITNRGSLEAPNVIMAIDSGTGLKVQKLRPLQDVDLVPNGNDRWNLGGLASGASKRFEAIVVATATQGNIVRLTINVSTGILDRDSANDRMSKDIRVVVSPQLRIQAISTGMLQIRWSATGGGFRLEAHDMELAPPSEWKSVFTDTDGDNGLYSIAPSSQLPRQMFRFRLIED